MIWAGSGNGGYTVRVAHFDCFSGISGDMTVAALLDAGVPFEPIRDGVASLGLPVKLEVEKVRKGGFLATYLHVEAPVETEHRHLAEVEEIIGRGQFTPRQRDLALGIFRRLAQAEAAVQQLHKDVESPEAMADSRKLQELYTALAAAQAKVDGLYARWQELGEKQG